MINRSHMAAILVLYGTGEGQTRKIASRLRQAFADEGHAVRIRDVQTLPDAFPLSSYDAVIIGSPIHRGKAHGSIRSIIREQHKQLNAMVSAYFQVSLASATDNPEKQAEAAGYVTDLLEATGWEPDRIAQFGGALRYSKYGFLTRMVMKRIAKGETGDIDTSQDYEYTDWEAVDAFARDVSSLVQESILQ